MVNIPPYTYTFKYALYTLIAKRTHAHIHNTYLAGPGALSLGSARFTSTSLPSMVCSLAMTTSAAAASFSLMKPKPLEMGAGRWV
ncbi:hypothetical protein EON63_22860 [archaeon]|nr:MAG: hypothetical protein EON63_22860 [archaeon]